VNASFVGWDKGGGCNNDLPILLTSPQLFINPKLFKNDYFGPAEGPMTKLFPPPPVGLMRPSDTGPTLKIADGSSDFINSFLLQAEAGLQTASQARRFMANSVIGRFVPELKPIFPVFHLLIFILSLVFFLHGFHRKDDPMRSLWIISAVLCLA
jgi:hypothetical protein